jgi:asparagine synthase (glutamine-hydrolysing)
VPQDERRYARIVSDYFRTHHEELVVSAADAAGVVERLGSLLDEPLADMSFVPLHLLSCAARRSVGVALTGDGGDELLCRLSEHGCGPMASRLRPPAARARVGDP